MRLATDLEVSNALTLFDSQLNHIKNVMVKQSTLAEKSSSNLVTTILGEGLAYL